MADLNAIAMPKWGLEMTEGTVVKWHVSEGDTVTKGQVIMDIETEKIANEFEAEFDGVIKKAIAQEGDTLAIGELLGVIGDADASDGDVDEFVGGYVSVAVGRVEATAAAPAAPAAAPAASSAPAADDSGVKASPPAKRLARKLGVDIAQVTGTGRGGRISAEDVQAFHDAGGAAAPAAEEAPAAAPAAPSGDVKASPVAKRRAKELGIDIATVTGTGRNGRISKEDVEAAAAGGGDAGSYGSTPVTEAPAAQVIPGDNPVTVEALNNMRKTIAKRLTESKQNTPHIYLTVDVEIDRLLERRAKYNATASVKTSVNDFVIRAAGMALRAVPKANVQFHGDELHYFENADISVAVAIDGGLITPIVRAANLKSVEQISTEMKDLAARARDNKLKLDEIQGGTFSITNLGMYGIKNFDAVINPPQGAILAIGAGEERLVAKNGAPAVATVMTVTMSCDHRSIDGALGAEFLQAFKELIEEPLALTV